MRGHGITDRRCASGFWEPGEVGRCRLPSAASEVRSREQRDAGSSGTTVPHSYIDLSWALLNSNSFLGVFCNFLFIKFNTFNMWLEYQNWSDLNSYSFQISGFSLLVLSLGNVYSKVRITITFRCFNYSVFPGPLFMYFKITKQNEIGIWVSHWSFLNFSFNTNSVSRSTYLCVILVYGLGLWPWNPMLRTLALKCCLTNFYFWMAGSEKIP